MLGPQDNELVIVSDGALCLAPWATVIDFFRLYILFSQYKSYDNTQEDWFVVLLIKKNACKHEYVCMHSF